MKKIYKIVSGGQTGADRGGLIAAKEWNAKVGAEIYRTGGWMPKGFKALDGCHPEFADIYGIIEHPSSTMYQPRTALNVKDSDGTIRIATNWKSAGEKLTYDMIIQYRKPHFDVHPSSTDPEDVAKFIIDNDIGILNVAGNSENTSRGIQLFTTEYMLAIFEELDLL